MKFKKSLVWLLALIIALCMVFTGCDANKDTDGKETKLTVQNNDGTKDNNANKDTETPTEAPEPEGVLSIDDVPAYSDKAFILINNGQPDFKESDLRTAAYEYYSPLDSLGRCGYVMACVCKDTMPTGPRGSIGHVNPTGWNNNVYEIVDGGYLYNRCHLIGWQLTGEDANRSNLITGTRYMNIEGMLPFENMVADYVKDTGNHVMYRITPIYDGNNLLASGVHLEGYSVEDKGAGICFNVYAYNVQPGVVINYATGENHLDEATKESLEETLGEGNYAFVVNKSSGTIHIPTCTYAKTMNTENRLESNDTLQNLLGQGYKACSKCKPNSAQ